MKESDTKNAVTQIESPVALKIENNSIKKSDSIQTELVEMQINKLNII